MSQDAKRDVVPPDGANGGTGADQENGGFGLYVHNLHYTANDLSELRKIDAQNPDLAHKIVDNHDQQHRREAVSERLGLVVTALLASVCVAGAVVIVITLGWWQTVIFICAMLGASHLVRTILTGEWSDTSWLGRMLRPNDKTDPEAR